MFRKVRAMLALAALVAGCGGAPGSTENTAGNGGGGSSSGSGGTAGTGGSAGAAPDSSTESHVVEFAPQPQPSDLQIPADAMAAVVVNNHFDDASWVPWHSFTPKPVNCKDTSIFVIGVDMQVPGYLSIPSKVLPEDCATFDTATPSAEPVVLAADLRGTWACDYLAPAFPASARHFVAELTMVPNSHTFSVSLDSFGFQIVGDVIQPAQVGGKTQTGTLTTDHHAFSLTTEVDEYHCSKQ